MSSVQIARWQVRGVTNLSISSGCAWSEDNILWILNICWHEMHFSVLIYRSIFRWGEKNLTTLFGLHLKTGHLFCKKTFATEDWRKFALVVIMHASQSQGNLVSLELEKDEGKKWIYRTPLSYMLASFILYVLTFLKFWELFILKEVGSVLELWKLLIISNLIKKNSGNYR